MPYADRWRNPRAGGQDRRHACLLRHTEGSRALIDKGFTDLGVDRITANTMTVNSGPGT